MSSVTVCAAKKAGVQRAEVSSHIVALPPFSQNSKVCAFAGLPQAQETQAKPSGLFWRSSVAAIAGPTRMRSPVSASPRIDPHPPVG